MKYYVPLDKPDQAVELARDKTWEFWQDLVDSDYDPDGMTITTTIKEVNGRYVIEIKQRRKTRLFFIFFIDGIPSGLSVYSSSVCHCRLIIFNDYVANFSRLSCDV